MYSMRRDFSFKTTRLSISLPYIHSLEKTEMIHVLGAVQSCTYNPIAAFRNSARGSTLMILNSWPILLSLSRNWRISVILFF